MATFTCPACRRLFENLENQAGACPTCGAAWEAHGENQSYIVEDVDMRSLARQQRWMVLFVVLTAGSMFAMLFGGILLSMTLFIGVIVIWVALRIVVIVGITRMAATMKWHVALIVLVAILMIPDGISLIVLLVVNSSATGRLRRAGLAVGFLGVRDEEVVQRLSRGLCRKCGYDLTGNISGRCPECGEPLPLATPVPVGEAVAGPPPKINEV